MENKYQSNLKHIKRLSRAFPDGIGRKSYLLLDGYDPRNTLKTFMERIKNKRNAG